MPHPPVDSAIHPTWFELIAEPVRLDVLFQLAKAEEASISELEPAVHASKPTVRKHIEALVGMGLVREYAGERDGVTQGRPAARFSLEPELRAGVAALLAALGEPAATWLRRSPAQDRDR